MRALSTFQLECSQTFLVFTHIIKLRNRKPSKGVHRKNLLSWRIIREVIEKEREDHSAFNFRWFQQPIRSSGVVLRVIQRCSNISQGVSRADEDERVRAKRCDAVDWDQIMDLQIKVTASWEQENELWVCQLFNNRRKIGRIKNSIHCILFGIELLAAQTNSK